MEGWSPGRGTELQGWGELVLRAKSCSYRVLPYPLLPLFLLGTSSPTPVQSLRALLKLLAYASPWDPSPRSLSCTTRPSPPLRFLLGWPSALFFSSGHAAPACGLLGPYPGWSCKVGPWRSPGCPGGGGVPRVHPHPTAVGLVFPATCPCLPCGDRKGVGGGSPASCCGVPPKPHSRGSPCSSGILEWWRESLSQRSSAQPFLNGGCSFCLYAAVTGSSPPQEAAPAVVSHQECLLYSQLHPV